MNRWILWMGGRIDRWIDKSEKQIKKVKKGRKEVQPGDCGLSC